MEAQLAPNNYMYSHSLTYTFDNYTNTGIQGTLAVTKNLFLQLGFAFGSDTALWNYHKTLPNPFPNVLYPGTRYRKDPGNLPSVTGCLRYE
ncbi:outer membrane beta-barrel protein, partial [Acinetobacter baumannii]